MHIPLFTAAIITAFLSFPGELRPADNPAMQKRVEEFWETENFAGLESLAEECREDQLSILDLYPRITRFYGAIRGNGVASDADAARRVERLNRWMAAFPDSVTARVALADFYITDAWRERGDAMAEEVQPAAWPVFHERLQKAKSILSATGMDIKADPTIAGLRTIILMTGEFSDRKDLTAPYEEAAKWWPDYLPVAENVARALLPRWGGKPGDTARFAAAAAERFSEPVSDGVYAQLADMTLQTEGLKTFSASGFDAGRFVRGLDALAIHNQPNFGYYSPQRAAYIEAMLGDPAAARQRIFEVGPQTIPSAYGSDDNIMPAWENCGAMAELRNGINLERAGKLSEAENFYRNLCAKPSEGWLTSFARRNGVERLWKPDYGAPSADLPVEQANANQLFDLAIFHMSAGNLDAARTYAKAFDHARPHNITGKYVLAADAALRGDAETLQTIKAQFLALKTNRPSYRLAQQYVDGKASWTQTKTALTEDDYFIQACSLMGAIALGEGRRNEAREIFEEVHRVMPLQKASAFPESMLWGALARKFPGALASAP